MTNPHSEIQAVAEELSANLTARYGNVLGASALAKELGYRSSAAFYQARVRGTVPIPIFQIKSRRGYFALTRDVALWLSQVRAQAANTQGDGE
jgi:hypothetical protein